MDVIATAICIDHIDSIYIKWSLLCMSILSLVISDVQVPKYSTVIPAIKMDGYDWTEFDSFTNEDLPIGCSIECSSASLQYFDLRVSTKLGIFSAQLSLSNEDNSSEIRISRAVTVLYNEEDSEKILLVTVAIAVRPCEPEIESLPLLPTRVYVETVSSYCQTEEHKLTVANKRIQCGPSSSNASCNTEGHVLHSEEIEMRLQERIEGHVEEYLKKYEGSSRSHGRSSEHPVDPAHPALGKAATTQELNLGHNIIPRIQQLTTLDSIIANQKQGIEKLQNMENRLLLSESVLRKAEQIRQRRGLGPSTAKDTVDTRPPKATATGPTAPPIAKPRPPTVRKLEVIDEVSTSTDRSSSSQASTSRSSNSSSKSSTEDDTESRSTSSSNSEENSSSSSSQDTVKDASTASPPLSPTSTYLKELRERILAERIDKA